MVEPELPASSGAAGSLERSALDHDLPVAALDRSPRAPPCAERRLAVRAGRVIGDRAGAFGDAGQHPVAVGNRFIAGQSDDSLDGPRGRNGFFHEFPSLTISGFIGDSRTGVAATSAGKP